MAEVAVAASDYDYITRFVLVVICTGDKAKRGLGNAQLLHFI